MGSKQTRAGQHLYLYAAGFVIMAFMVTGCLHLPNPWQGQQHLEMARQHFSGGDYKAALEENQMVLDRFPSRLADQALFQIGQIYAHPQNPDFNYQKSLASFQQIVDQYPASRVCAEAELWLLTIRRLIDQEKRIQKLNAKNIPLEKTLKSKKRRIKQLQDQLEKLKRIDIKIEEQKRDAIPQAEEIKEKDNGNGKNSGS